MKQTINFSQFTDAFGDMNKDNNFSYEGKRALFDYLESYEEDTGEEKELDVIGLCCEYREYANLEEFQSDYNADDYKTIEDVGEKTTVIRIDDTAFIIQSF